MQPRPSLLLTLTSTLVVSGALAAQSGTSHPAATTASAPAAVGQESSRTPLLRPERTPPPFPARVEGDVRVSSAPKDLTTRFQEGGVEITPAAGAPTLRLALAAWGRAKTRAATLSAGKTTRGNRVEYRRGAVTEWFVDGRHGLQQGFTVAAPPGGALGDRSAHGLELELDLGGWRAEVLPGGRDAELVDASGEWRLTYSGLLAWDANRVVLDAELVAGEGRLTIRVDDRDAAYPLTIDPWIATELTRLDHPVPTSFDEFGQSVAISGKTMVIGTPGDDHTGAANSGRIDILVGEGPSWTTQDAFVGSAAGDRAGQSVAIQGETVAFGAPLYDTFGIPDAGAAWILRRSGSTWSFEAALALSGVGGAANFGASVAVYADTVLVGAPLDDHSGRTDVGAGEVFVRSGTSWASQGLLYPSPAVDFAQAGVSVAVQADVAVLGAADDSFYVFQRSAGVWTQLQRITGPAGSQFGSRVAINGGRILAGAPAEDHSALIDPGAVYVFLRSGSTYAQEARVTASEPATDGRYGASVALGHDYDVGFLLVGAPGQDSGRGAVYALRRSGSSWSEQDEVSAAAGVAGDAFGTSVSVSILAIGGEFLVGAPGDDHSSRTDAGSAFVFRGSKASYPQHFNHLESSALLEPQDGWTALLGAVLDPASHGYLFASDASRVADEASPFPALDGSERDAYLQVDHIEYLTGSLLRFGVATDSNGDGSVGLTDTAQQGPMIQSRLEVDHAVFQVIAADDSIHESIVPGDFSATTDVIRLRLVMNLSANGGSGSGSLYWRRLSGSAFQAGAYAPTGSFLAVPGLQNIDLELSTVPNDGRNPTRWDALFAYSPNEAGMDNLTVAESASGYDFDCLPAKDTGIFEPLFEGGWVATPRNTSIRTGVTESLSHDGTSCLAFDQSGPGVGCDQSLVDSPGYWSLPAFDGRERNVTVQFDATVSFWGNFFGLASDLDGSRHVTLNDAAERGPELVLFATSGGGVRLRAADGTTTTVPLPAGSTGGHWLRMKLEMDLRTNGGSGLGNVFAMNLTNGETEFTPVAGLQGIDLRLDRADTSARDPRRWNGLFSHFEGAGNRLDNLAICGNPYRHKVRER